MMRPRWLRKRKGLLVTVTHTTDPDAVVKAIRRYIDRNGPISGC